MNNLKQIGVGMTVYADDNHGLVLQVRTPGPSGVENAINPPEATEMKTLGLPIQPGGSTIWNCPDRNYNNPGLAHYDSVYNQWVIGYVFFGGVTNWYPGFGGNYNQAMPGHSPVNVNFAKPEWVLAADANIKFASAGSWAAGPAHVTSKDPPRCYVCADIPPHPQDSQPAGDNEVFMDGLAKRCRFDSMYHFES